MAMGHMPRRSKSGRFLKGRWSSRTSGSGRRAKYHHGRHSKARYRVVCKGRTKSWHRLLKAAKNARPKGCRVAKV